MIWNLDSHRWHNRDTIKEIKTSAVFFQPSHLVNAFFVGALPNLVIKLE